MYESFFGCRQRPFAAAPQVERYFPGRAIESVWQTVYRCTARAEGAAMIVGPAGTGKSLLCAKLAEAFRDQFAIARLGHGGLTTRRAFFQAVLYELNLPYRGMEEGELRLSLIDRLTADATDRGMVLIVDDAHALPLRLLEEIRMLADLARRGEPRVRLVLAGASSLEERLSVPRLSTLQQRITARGYLEAMDRNDTLAYVRQQITAVGGDPTAVFTEAAIDAVYRATEGIPRLINQTCDHALVLACAGGAKPIDVAGIEEAWSDLQQLPTPWSRAQGYAGPANIDNVIEFGTPDEADAKPIAPTANTPAADLPKSPSQPTIAHNASTGDSIELVASAPRDLERPAEDALDVIETQLAEWESEFMPAAEHEPEVELILSNHRRDPFTESFVEEEVVVDRYAAADRLYGPKVQSYGSQARLIADLFAERTAPATPNLRVAEASHAETRVESHRAESHHAESQAVPKAAPPASLPIMNIDDDLPMNVVGPNDEIVSDRRAPQPHARFNKEPDPVEPEDMVIIPRRSTGDADMIIVEDDPTDDGRPGEATLVRNKDYGRMFARLRRTT